MREPATKAGVSPMASYYYFASRDALFERIKLAALDELWDALEGAIEKAWSTATAAQKLGTLCRAFIDRSPQRPPRSAFSGNIHPHNRKRRTQRMNANMASAKLCGHQATIIRMAGLAAAVLFLTGTGGFAAKAGAETAEGRKISVSISPGSSYSHTKWFGIIPVTLRPQIAVWIETGAGGYVDTIYVSKASGKNSFKGGARRPEALPVWAASRGIRAADGLYMPTSTQAIPDAISGATPSGSLTVDYVPQAPLPEGSYRVLVEINESYDYNRAYPDKLPASDPHNSGVNGQPSLVYAADISLGGDAVQASLVPIGTGSLNGEDGRISPGIDGLDSALSIVSKIVLSYTP